ncbi:AmmeMemoRadiSam system radical SAM enzyme [bacterium]|nr:AmmeMemoRadiSam system radical SAM enzyme [bacterium]
MKEAMFYEKLQDSMVRCTLCPRYCVIRPGKRGYCGARINKDGILYTLTYGLVSSIANDPIEKKPLFHFYPGSLVLSLGTFGCNMRCPGCQNWEIAHVDPSGFPNLSPKECVELAIRERSKGIAWTYNEPTVWFEFTYETATIAREKGLYTVYVTNGYINQEPLDTIARYLSAYRVDVKAFKPEAYSRIANVRDFQPILNSAIRAKKNWGIHVEIVTNVTPTINDDEEQLRGIAVWIRDNLGPETPWHVTRFVPHYELRNLYVTPLATLERAYDIARNVGLRYVYIGNVPGHQYENTYCYNCNSLLIERFGFSIEKYLMEDGRCPKCGAEQYIVGGN